MAFNEGVKGLLRVPWNSQNWFRCRLTHFEHQNCFWRFLDCLGGGRGAPGDSATDCIILFFLCFFASLGLLAEEIGLRRGKIVCGTEDSTSTML